MKPVSFLRDLSPVLLVGLLAVALSSFWQLTWVGLLVLIALLLIGSCISAAIVDKKLQLKELTLLLQKLLQLLHLPQVVLASN